MQVQIATPGCPTIGLVLEQAVRHHDPAWVTPVGQRVTFACHCDTPGEVDATYEKMTVYSAAQGLTARRHLRPSNPTVPRTAQPSRGLHQIIVSKINDLAAGTWR